MQESIYSKILKLGTGHTFDIRVTKSNENIFILQNLEKKMKNGLGIILLYFMTI